MNNYERSTKKYYFIFICTGIISGFLCGFLGTGGGILTVFALTKFGPRFIEPEISGKSDFSRDCFAMTIATVLPASAMSALIYYKTGAIEFVGTRASELAQFLIPAAIGGMVGAIILDKINTSFLKKLFGALIIFGGAMLIFR